jgi:2-polyprenyl-3-methyl-5-hydroxy-6-metoxy-1,4-benzoquinol methylase
MTQPICSVCGSGPLHEIMAFAKLSRVTSDCKPWPNGGKLHCCEQCGAVQKIANNVWFDEIKQIYSAYEIYHLSGGSEQVIFAGDAGGMPRSRALVDFVVSTAKLGPQGRLIDIGCGNGAAIVNFSSALPGWKLSGSELADKALSRLQKLPNFEKLYTVDVADIPGKFDVVTLIHALEHMPAPHDTLTASRARLVDGGHLLIEVPDLETSPFDIAVADHRSHFTRATLGYLASRAGATAGTLRNDLLPKEITFLGGFGNGKPAPKPNPADGRALAEATVRWLGEVQAAAEAAAKSKPFGIFGTSISGMWLYGALRDRVEFFVDEDRSRIGQSYEERPILAPDNAPAGSTVFVPLAPRIAEKVAARLSGKQARFSAPPPFQ